jgi:hypothetical protein
MENQTSKYFKYAIGEIILVVIGILIALQINNWNEERLNSNKESALLANIHKEFKQNKKQLDSVIKEHKKVQTSINALASTSSFNIIKNETLRDLLISWNDLIKDYQEEEIRSREHMIQQYDPYMSKHFDWNFDFNDKRNNFVAFQTLEFEYLVKNNYDLVNQILTASGELQKVQQTLDDIIELSNPPSNPDL